MKSKYFNPMQNDEARIRQRFAPKIVSKRMMMSQLTFLASIAYMADILNLANCAAPDSVFNVGVPLCDLAKKKMKGVIFADKGTTFTGADIQSSTAFIQAIKTATTAARGGRVYPIWDIINFEDSTGDPTTGGIGNLTTATIIVSDTVPVFRFGYSGSEARHTRISAMSGSSLDIFFVDEGFNVYGTSDGAGGFRGYTILQAYAYSSKFIVADAINQYSFRITLASIAEYRDQSIFVSANAGIISAVGLINVALKELSATANVFHIQPIADGGTNLEPTYGTILDGLTWTAENLETGNSFTITSVADNAGDKSLIFTMDSTAWTALTTGDRVQINGPSASDLAAAGVKPFEILPIIVVKAP